MIFIWGKKTKLKKQGTVADFCSICRDVTACDLSEVRVVRHVYHIPLGSGTLMGHVNRCQTCGTSYKADVKDYPSFSNDGTRDAAVLLEAAGSGVKARIAKRRELEKRMRARSLSVEERTALLREPFVVLSPRVDVRLGTTHFDWTSGGALLATIATFILLVSLSDGFSEPLKTDFGIAAVAAILFGALATVWFLFTDTSRFVRKRLHPLLARALSPLNPTSEEIDAVVKRLKTEGLSLAKKLKPAKLIEDLDVAVKGEGQLQYAKIG